MRRAFRRSRISVIAIAAAACILAAPVASARPVCRTVLPNGRIILSRPVLAQGRLFCRSPFIARHPRQQIPRAIGRGALPSMSFTTGPIGPFTTGEVGPFTTFSNSAPRPAARVGVPSPGMRAGGR